MKRILFQFTMAIALIAAAGAFFASTRSIEQSASPFYTYSWTDTITNTEVDTLLIPARLISKWTGLYHVQTTQLSGTQAIAVDLYQSASTGGTDWVLVDTCADLSGSTDLDKITDATVEGFRQRLRLTGSGTQSTRYTVYATFKKD